MTNFSESNKADFKEFAKQTGAMAPAYADTMRKLWKTSPAIEVQGSNVEVMPQPDTTHLTAWVEVA
jgi:hypothetical protein